MRPMIEVAPARETPPGAEPAQAARRRIMRALSDVVTAPGATLTANERELAADVLIGLIHECPAPLRQRLAHRLASLKEAPRRLVRALARQEIEIAEPLLRDGICLDEGDLIAVLRASTPAHWRLIAARRSVAPAVADALIATGEPGSIEVLLRNAQASLSSQGLEAILRVSRDHPRLSAPLLARPELRPAQAHVLFWWATAEQRRLILKRFAVEREAISERLAEVFPDVIRLCAHHDADALRVLQILDRRQIDRKALARFGAETLEALIQSALLDGANDPERLGEIAIAAGIRPSTLGRIAADPGGEPAAVFAKATGLKRSGLAALWRLLGRPFDEAPERPWGSALSVYEGISIGKAQTALRYWNWGFGDPDADEPETLTEAAPSRPGDWRIPH